MYPKVLVLTAAGSSTRMGCGKKKEYLELKGGTVLSEAAAAFFDSADFDVLVVTIPVGHHEQAKSALFRDKRILELSKRTQILLAEGDKTRQSSVFKGLLKAKEFLEDRGLDVSKSIVLVHDAARPFVTGEVIRNVIDGVLSHAACAPGIPPVDTQKQIDGNGFITRHLRRDSLTSIQTPQGFLLAPLIECHRQASADGLECTDDTELWDAYPQFTENRKVFITEGSVTNKKITFASDLKKTEAKMIRIGFGTDLHRLVEGRRFILGGVEIPAEKGELGHSDGDVLLHAISDALLGASGLGDIGSYFPPDDPQWKDADSKILIKKIWDDVKAAGFSLENLDCVVETEKPKFLPWRDKVIESIASTLEVEKDKVFVKAKTNEKQDSVGEGNAVKAYCACLLSKQDAVSFTNSKNTI